MLSVHRTPKQLKRVRKKSRTDPSSCPDSSVSISKPQHKNPMHPFLRANPFPEVTDLFCRLPLSTLFYQPEAVHLGDLLRLLVRPGVRIIVRAWIFKGRRERAGPGRRARLFQPRYPISGQTVSRVVVLLRRKDNSS